MEEDKVIILLGEDLKKVTGLLKEMDDIFQEIFKQQEETNKTLNRMSEIIDNQKIK